MSSKTNSLDKLNKMLAFKSEKEKSDLEEELLNLKFITSIELMMEQKDLNQNDLAKILQTSRSYVSQLFSGFKMINIKTLSKIQKGLNITFKIEAIENQKFEFQKISCDMHKRVGLNDIAINPNDRLYSLSKDPKKKEKISA
jgi:transcriptional regulator with XRE-family HTH domain